MALKIVWTAFAKSELRKIFNYYLVNATANVAINLTTGIVKRTQILKSHPHAGKTEELLTERIHDFRYLVYKNYKIIYWVNIKKRRIEVVDVFDSRQNPEKITRNQ